MMPRSSSTSSTRTGFLERLALHRPELRAWALYDWANSAFYTVVITAVFPYFFAKIAAAGMSETEIRRRFTLVTTLCMAVAAVLGPILGAVADYGRMKKKLFAVFFGLGVLSTGAMFTIHRGDWVLAAALFALANIGISTSFVFYDSMLAHVAREGEADRLSTSGYAVGYLGGGICLALCIALIRWGEQLGIRVDPPGDPMGSDWLTARIGFAVVAVWWLVFTIPYLLRVGEPELGTESDERPGSNPVKVAFVRIGETLRELSRYRQAFLLLLAFLAYSDGIGTIIRMAGLYAAELKIPEATAIGCILLVQFVGIPFAVLFGRLAGRIGAKGAVLIALLGYVVICVWASQVEKSWEFVVMAIMVGMVQGGAQALSRSLFASLVPKHKSGEFFGLFSTLDKFAGILGPLVFGLAASGRAAVLWVIAFFVLGATLLLFVDVEAGQRAARESDAGLPDPR